MANLTLEQAIETLNNLDTIEVTVGDNSTFIGDSQEYVGAPDVDEVPVSFISQYLGNTYYTNAAAIIRTTVLEMQDGDESLTPVYTLG